MAMPLVNSVEIPCVAEVGAVHDGRNVGSVNVDDEMSVVIHQTICKDFEVIKILVFLHKIQIDSLILVVSEKVHFAYASNHDVEYGAVGFVSRCSWQYDHLNIMFYYYYCQFRE